MRLLLTNDDGFGAEGIEILRRLASKISSEIWVVAPSRDRSGSSRSMTLRTPIAVNKLTEREFAVDGTPSECVVIALHELMKFPPDLILSGINSGSNIGADVGCSGTVGAALEGALFKIPSIALSQRYSDKTLPTNWEVAKNHTLPIIKSLLNSDWDPSIVMNINFPDVLEVKGTKFVKQGRHFDLNDLSCHTDDNGRQFFVINGNRPAIGDGSVEAVQQGFIAITPIKSDF